MDKFHKDNIYVSAIVLKVKDLNRAKIFYTKIMGFEILEETSQEVILSPDGKNALITLIKPNDVIEKLPNKTGLYHFALLLSSEKQLGLFLKHIKAQGYPLTGASNHGVSEAIYLQDPDYNGIEVYCDTDSQDWDRDGDQINMVTERLDHEKLLTLVENDNWQGIDPETIIGHIHLHVSNLQDAKDFYVDGLGFDLTMTLEDSALFLSTEGYHHHIGLNTWNGKNIDAQPTNATGMDYYTLLFPDEEQLNDTINQFNSLDYQVMNKDEDFFLKDPSENLIKLTFKE